jgi:hypothetical protein
MNKNEIDRRICDMLTMHKQNRKIPCESNLMSCRIIHNVTNSSFECFKFVVVILRIEFSYSPIEHMTTDKDRQTFAHDRLYLSETSRTTSSSFDLYVDVRRRRLYVS